MVITVELDVMMCVLVGGFQCLGGTFFLALQDHPSELQVEAAGFSETLLTSYQTVRHHIPTKKHIYLAQKPQMLQDPENLEQTFLSRLLNNAITMSIYAA